jgi:MFS family permease
MNKKQLALLGVCNFVTFAVGAGLTGLLPVYMSSLGADSTTTGFFLAFAFFCLALSNILGGRLSDRLGRRKGLLILGGLLAAPTALLLTQATTVLGLTILTGILWLVGGLVGVMVNVLAGLFSEPGERGRIFGFLGMCISLGAFFGGLVCGAIVDRWGYSTLFVLIALFYLIIPLAGFFLADKQVAPPSAAGAAPSHQGLPLTRTFLFLCIASSLAHLANSGILLTRPLIMDALDFDATTISNAGGIGALLVLPLPLLVGWLSDRLGRKPFIFVCYLVSGLGLLVLTAASAEWHFWAASAFQSVMGMSMIVGSALITDTTPKASLGSSLSLFNATPWIGFVVGFGGGGAAISALQMNPTLMLGIALTIIAIFLLIPISSRTPSHMPDAPTPSYGEVS